MSKYTELFVAGTGTHLGAPGRLLDDALGGSDAAALREMGRLFHPIKGMALFEEQESIAGPAQTPEKASTGESRSDPAEMVNLLARRTGEG